MHLTHVSDSAVSLAVAPLVLAKSILCTNAQSAFSSIVPNPTHHSAVVPHPRQHPLPGIFTLTFKIHENHPITAAAA